MKISLSTLSLLGIITLSSADLITARDANALVIKSLEDKYHANKQACDGFLNELNREVTREAAKGHRKAIVSYTGYEACDSDTISYIIKKKGYEFDWSTVSW